MATDAHCPECHCPAEKIELRLVKRDRLIKQCPECNHKWAQPRDGVTHELETLLVID
jgi:hypothetical protein